nr:11888_t:CDS:2 [Entrophospora candida]CAG8485172.1 9931_t:CDS:2 [Entrophospora candida]
MKIRCYILTLASFLFSTTNYVFCDKSAQQYLEEGSELFKRSLYEEALKNYDAAIGQEPDNYLSYFKRATTHLALKSNSFALQDFSKVLELRPDFDQALIQRAKLFITEGSLAEAKRDLTKYFKKAPKDDAVKKLLESITKAEESILKAEKLFKEKNYEGCINELSLALDISPKSYKSRLLRSECYLANGEVEQGVRDLTYVSKIKSLDLNHFVKLAKLYFFSLYNPEQADKAIKDCLRSDPENATCKSLRKKTRNLKKEIDRVAGDIDGKRFTLAIKKLFGSYVESNKNKNDQNKQNRRQATNDNKSTGLIKEIKDEIQNAKEILVKNELLKQLYEWTCISYSELKDTKNTLEWCSETLKFDENNTEALINRGEAYIKEEEYDAAMEDFKKAHDIKPDNRATQGFQKANKLKKMAKKKDYYKILGVPRSASTRDIKKAYRKLAQQWHPDKYKGDLTLQQVEAKMSSINEAYEVLSNDQLRERYDNGEDPNDPDRQNSNFFYSDGNPFTEFSRHGFQFGGFPFGGSGEGDGHYSFQFNFP